MAKTDARETKTPTLGVKSSSQKLIGFRPPRTDRVRIGYKVETYSGEKHIELPFVLGVLAGLSGASDPELPPVSERRFVEIDIDNFDDRLKSIRPRVVFDVPDSVSGTGTMKVDITFERYDDFLPGKIAQRLPSTSRPLEVRVGLANLVSYMDSTRGTEEQFIKDLLRDPALLRSYAMLEPTEPIEAAATTEPKNESNAAKTAPNSNGNFQEPPVGADDLVSRLRNAFRPKSNRAAIQIQRAVANLAQQVLARPEVISSDAFATVNRVIDELDSHIGPQVDIVLHHPDFQALEGSWRGLHYLVTQTETGELSKIRVLNITKRELAKTFREYVGTAWQQSPLFKKMYQEEYGQLGGQPFACFVGDYYFDHRPADVELLTDIARIAAAAHAPFVTGAAPSILDIDSWQEIADPRDLTHVFSTPEYAGWRSLRGSDDSRYLALAMPRMLSRSPYGNHNPVDEFEYQESVMIGEAGHHTWCNAAYGMAAVIMHAATEFGGWCARIRGLESGGRLPAPPAPVYPWRGTRAIDSSWTEVAISDRWEASLATMGLLPLVHRKDTDGAVFIGAQSLQAPAKYDDPDETARAMLVAQLPYLFACCRFAHYIKCIARDRIGSYADRSAWERVLNDWIAQYVDPDPANSPDAHKAAKPLASAEIVLEDVEGVPNMHRATLLIRPHYQLEELSVSLRLVLVLELDVT